MSRTLRRTTLALAASASLIAFAPAALAAPDPSFTVLPNPPVSGQPATYTSTSTPDAGFGIAKVEWDFDNDGTFEVVDEVAPWDATHTYASAGDKTFVMKVTDDNVLLPAVMSEDQTVTVATRPPTAVFAFNPLSPFVGDDVLFASNSSDPDGDSLAHLWSFGDGVTSPLRNPTHAFSTPGTKTVTLTVIDSFNASHAITHQVVVQGIPVSTPAANKPPLANFAFGPRSPQVGDPVEFVSSAVDPEGDLRSQTWDLDGDGQFDDARGDEVVYTFGSPGTKTVRLRVEDAAGGAAVRERTLTVKAGPVARAGFLTPAPVIRLNGEILSTGARIKVLSARAPRGSLVTVKCRGKGCPATQRRKRVKASVVRFKTFERFLRAGIRLEILVRKPNTIGDYTRYKIRAGKFPVRTDRCLPAGTNKPAKSCR